MGSDLSVRPHFSERLGLAMAPVVVVAVIFMIPVTFVIGPAVVVMIVVGVSPIGARIGRP